MFNALRVRFVSLITMFAAAVLLATCPEYVSSQAYKVGDKVMFEGKGYICVNACSPWERPSVNSWFWDETTECDAAVSYSLTVNTVGNGSVSISPSGGTYDAGTVVTLTATPATNCESFVSWTGNPVNNQTVSQTTVTMGADYSITATFEDNGSCNTTPQYSVNVSALGNGLVTLTPTGGTYDEGTQVTVTAAASSSCDSFDKWIGAPATATTNSFVLTVDKDYTFSAEFIDNGSCVPTEAKYPNVCGANDNMKVDGEILVGATTISNGLVETNGANVNGTVKAREVIVTHKNWPDYVFRPGYKLNTLEEVESYIASNGHLPNMPSEAEVEANGYSVGDVQGKLLEKVEEMTLYIISLEKRVNELELQAK